MSTHRRASPRRNTQQPGLICNSDGSIVSSCVMTDVSATGAKLILDGAPEVPDEFVLLLSKGGKVHRRCKVIRRFETGIAVKFVLPLAARPTAKNAAQ